ncbi:MAG: hypothetical protein R3B72_35875 [Polyangiaceae bacterium]
MIRRRRNLRRAVAVTVSAAFVSLGAGACDDGVEPAGGNTTAPPCVEEDCSDRCRIDAPPHGADCSIRDLTCDYPCMSFGEGKRATCVDGRWQVVVSYCHPPPPTCPDDAAPEAGSPCDGEVTTGTCDYVVATPCGEATLSMSCQSMTWRMAIPPVSCELPPEGCQLYGSKATCDADGGCQWLVPGCPDGRSDVAKGCFPIGDCTVTGCGAWGECRSIVPCQDSSCTTCNEAIDVCVGIDAP